MSMLGTKQPTEYTDGRTKQSFKDETDVNNIIAKHARMDTQVCSSLLDRC